MTYHEKIAYELFLSGYNCSQSVLIAFSDVTGLDSRLSAAISSSFGGGVGRMRELCGALSGALMAAGLIFGGECTDRSKKSAHYARVRFIAEKFREKSGSILCRDILGLEPGVSGGEPSERTPEFYASRPCGAMIRLAARILDEYIDAHKNEIINNSFDDIGEK